MPESLEEHIAMMAKEGSGFVGALNAQQKAIYDQFRAAVTDDECAFIKHAHETNEGIICKFLRARKYDLNKALAFWKESIKFRNDFGFPRLRQMEEIDVHGFPADEFIKYYPGWQCCHDKLGRPVWYEQTGKLNIPLLLRCVSQDLLLQAYVVGIESGRTMLQQEGQKKSGRYVEATTSIIDLEGMNMGLTGKEARNYLGALSTLNSTCYPESMGKLFVINAPFLFTSSWGVIKGLLDERTISKIEVLGGPEQWKPRLLEFIDADQLPVELGGKSTKPGGSFPCNPTSVDVIVARGGNKVETSLRLDAAGKVGGWEWYTQASEINFKCDFVGDSGKTTVIQADETFATPYVKMLKDKFTAPEAGTLKFTWTNNSGWSQRELCYRTYVIEPKVKKVEEKSAPAAPLPPVDASSTSAPAPPLPL